MYDLHTIIALNAEQKAALQPSPGPSPDSYLVEQAERCRHAADAIQSLNWFSTYPGWEYWREAYKRLEEAAVLYETKAKGGTNA